MGRSLQRKLPPEIHSKKRRVRKRLRAAILDRHYAREAEARLDETVTEVKMRHAEFRNDMTAAAAEQSVIGARKNFILQSLYVDFVRRWGFTTDEALLRQNVRLYLIRELRLAHQFLTTLESVPRDDREAIERTISECARICHLSAGERRVYERSVADLVADDEDAARLIAEPVPRWKVFGAGFIILAVFALCIVWLLVFATDVGNRQSLLWLVECAFVVSIIYLLVAPSNVFLIYVALPALIGEKMRHNPKINSLTYPHETPLPEDALDFVFVLKPRYRSYLAEPDDHLVRELRRASKAAVTVAMLEEIEIDRKWQTMATVAVGLVVASAFLSLPIVAQETLVDEIFLLMPILAFAILQALLGIRLEGTAWSTVALGVLSIAIAALVFYALTVVVIATHKRFLVRRDAEIKKHRETTAAFLAASGVDPAASPSSEGLPGEDSADQKYRPPPVEGTSPTFLEEDLDDEDINYDDLPYLEGKEEV